MRVQAHAAALALLVAATTATAAPKTKPARKEFDRGVAAYTKGDYQSASDALAKSFAIEADEETLFAWAQTERKLGHCDKAVELYTKLLTMNLPAENKKAVRVQIDECNQILQEERAAAAVLEAPPDATSPSTSSPSGTSTSTSTSSADSSGPSLSPSQPKDTTTGSDGWYKDPIGGALVGAGAVGLALGTVFLVQASSADSDKATASTYDQYQSLADRAESRGRLAVISLVAGGALVTAGVIRYATRRSSSETRTLSGWLAPTTAGLTLSGQF